MGPFLKSLIGGLVSKVGVADLRRVVFSARCDVAGPDLYPDFVKELAVGPVALRIEVGQDDSGDHFLELGGVYTD